MYLTVSMGQSQMQRPTELFIKNFFLLMRWSPDFSTFEPTSSPHPPKQVQLNLVVNNKFPQYQPSSIRVKSPLPRFTDHHKQDFSLLAPASNYNLLG